MVPLYFFITVNRLLSVTFSFFYNNTARLTSYSQDFNTDGG